MSPGPARRGAAGFTLLEMLVALAVGAILIAGGVSLLLSQQRTFQSSASDRALQETARVALGELSGTLRMAGYGVDPPLAFDFGPASNVTMKASPRMAGASVQNPGYLCATAVTCRDSITGPDEIVFHSRDPFFGHRLVSASSSAISITGPLNVDLEPGQILQVMCTTDPMYWVYVTVGAHVARNALAATVVVPLRANPGQPLDFPFQNAALSDAGASVCFTGGATLVTKVDRYRYFVRTYDSAGNERPPLTPGSRPFLMLDQGLLDAGGAPLPPTPIAPDVEDLQFSYVYPRGLGLVGATSGTSIAAGAAGIDLAPANGIPGYGTPATDASRQNQFPSNIRAVRVSVVVRSATANLAVPDAVVPGAANRPDVPGLAGYRRMRFETTVPVRNLDARYPYYPILSTSAADMNNVGGG